MNENREDAKAEIAGLVRNLPGSLIQVYSGGENVSVSGISPLFLALRFPQGENVPEYADLDLHYLDFRARRYEERHFLQAGLESADDRGDYLEAVYRIPEKEFAEVYDFITRQYANYIHCRAGAVDNFFSKELAGYPYEEDTQMAESAQAWYMARKERMELLHQEVLRLTAESRERVYLGSQFCHMLVPSWEALRRQMEEMKATGHPITLCLPYLSESRVLQMQKLLHSVYDWCRQQGEHIEVLYNDYGYEDVQTFDCLQSADHFTWHRGALLDKTKKDPRLKYHMSDRNLPLQMERDADDTGTVYLPFYRISTSQYCTLRALVQKGDRARQSEVLSCEGLCRKYVCIYPEHLNLLGIGNSLWSVEERLLEDPSRLTDYVRQHHVKRIVWNLSLLPGLSGQQEKYFFSGEVRG
jgi:hypothetical protein